MFNLGHVLWKIFWILYNEQVFCLNGLRDWVASGEETQNIEVNRKE